VITPDCLASWRRKATPGTPSGAALLAACNEIERLQDEVRRQAGRLHDFEDGHAYTKVRREADYWQAHHEGDRRHAEGLILGHLADRDLARRWAVELEQQLAEIKRLAYIGGQNGEIVRRCIIGVFEDDRRALEGGEAPC
jgi:hypothetical protein